MRPTYSSRSVDQRFIVGATFLVSIRDEKVDIKLDDLKGRLRVIRLALILVSMILVLYVIVGKLLLQWPLSLLVEPQQLALQRLIDAVISYWGAIATIALLTIFTPARRGRAASRLEQMTDAPSWSRTLPPRCFGSPLRMGLLQIDSQSALHIGVSAGVGAVAPALSIVGPELHLPRGFGAGARGERGSGRCQEKDAEHTDIFPSNLRWRLPWLHGRS
jgi:hypothetical protein